MASPHPGVSCVKAASLSEAWASFLRTAVAPGAGNGGEGAGGEGAGGEGAGGGTAHAAALAAVLLQMEQKKADVEYLNLKCRRAKAHARHPLHAQSHRHLGLPPR